jgi:hypothetical protein
MNIEHTNRYGQNFTFRLQPDGNILWEGDFNYCRFGYEKDYHDAYNAYCQDGGFLSKSDFIREIQRDEIDDSGRVIITSILADYSHLIKTDFTKMSMVDPSGGPYMSSGLTIMGKKIEKFVVKDDGILIITKKI